MPVFLKMALAVALLLATSLNGSSALAGPYDPSPLKAVTSNAKAWLKEWQARRNLARRTCMDYLTPTSPAIHRYYKNQKGEWRAGVWDQISISDDDRAYAKYSIADLYRALESDDIGIPRRKAAILLSRYEMPRPVPGRSSAKTSSLDKRV